MFFWVPVSPRPCHNSFTELYLKGESSLGENVVGNCLQEHTVVQKMDRCKVSVDLLDPLRAALSTPTSESPRKTVREFCCLAEMGSSTGNRKIQRQLIPLRKISCTASLQHLINHKSSLLLCILQCQKHYRLIKLFHCFAISSNMSL